MRRVTLQWNSFAELNLPHSGQGDGVETDLRKRTPLENSNFQGKNENDVSTYC